MQNPWLLPHQAENFPYTTELFDMDHRIEVHPYNRMQTVEFSWCHHCGAISRRRLKSHTAHNAKALAAALTMARIPRWTCISRQVLFLSFARFCFGFNCTHFACASSLHTADRKRERLTDWLAEQPKGLVWTCSDNNYPPAIIVWARSGRLKLGQLINNNQQPSYMKQSSSINHKHKQPRTNWKRTPTCVYIFVFI